MKWVIYYTNGDTYSNEDGEPADAPGGGVVAIAQEDKTVGHQVHYERDWYIFGEAYGGWAAVKDNGLSQYIMDRGKLIIKIGKMMPTDVYCKLIRQIQKDPRLPRKSARYSWEAPI